MTLDETEGQNAPEKVSGYVSGGETRSEGAREAFPDCGCERDILAQQLRLALVYLDHGEKTSGAAMVRAVLEVLEGEKQTPDKSGFIWRHDDEVRAKLIQVYVALAVGCVHRQDYDEALRALDQAQAVNASRVDDCKEARNA